MSAVLASWWGYADGNPTLVAIVVAIIVIAAVAYVVRGLWRR
jgi:hypothetical protein